MSKYKLVRDTKSRQEEMLRSFLIGVKATAVYLNDIMDLSDEDIAYACQGAIDLMSAIGEGRENWYHIDKELTKMTGIDFNEIGRGCK